MATLPKFLMSPRTKLEKWNNDLYSIVRRWTATIDKGDYCISWWRRIVYGNVNTLLNIIYYRPSSKRKQELWIVVVRRLWRVDREDDNERKKYASRVNGCFAEIWYDAASTQVPAVRPIPPAPAFLLLPGILVTDGNVSHVPLCCNSCSLVLPPAHCGDFYTIQLHLIILRVRWKNVKKFPSKI